uniref:Uncharacterized protein n=1 Tax=Sphaerodactylus townsendi TaxID=933632 RepID=A0ACB8FV16_9SAUR
MLLLQRESHNPLVSFLPSTEAFRRSRRVRGHSCKRAHAPPASPPPLKAKSRRRSDSGCANTRTKEGLQRRGHFLGAQKKGRGGRCFPRVASTWRQALKVRAAAVPVKAFLQEKLLRSLARLQLDWDLSPPLVLVQQERVGSALLAAWGHFSRPVAFWLVQDRAGDSAPGTPLTEAAFSESQKLMDSSLA